MAQSKSDFAKANGFSSSWSSNPSTGKVDSGSSSSSSSSKSSSSSSKSSSSSGSSSKGYAYTDKYGFTHVTSDYNTAKQYSGNGNVYDYSGSYGGGYAKNENGGRINLDLPGATSFGNGKNDSFGGGDYIGGISNPSYNNYVYNATPTNTAAMAQKYTPASDGLVPIRSAFTGAGYGVDYDAKTGNISIKDSSGKLLDTLLKGSYAMRDGQAYLNPAFAQSTMGLLSAPTPSQPAAMPALQQQYVEPVPQLDMLQPFQYQPFQMSPNLPQMSSGGDTWAPTLSAKQQWYGQQDQLRNSYLDDWYRKQALAQDKAKMDYEKEIYNSPYEQAKRDMALEAAKLELQDMQNKVSGTGVYAPRSSGGGRSYSGGGGGYSTTTVSKQTADAAQQFISDVRAGRYTPGDALRMLQDPAIRRGIELQGGNPDQVAAEITTTYAPRGH